MEFYDDFELCSCCGKRFNYKDFVVYQNVYAGEIQLCPDCFNQNPRSELEWAGNKKEKYNLFKSPEKEDNMFIGFELEMGLDDEEEFYDLTKESFYKRNNREFLFFKSDESLGSDYIDDFLFEIVSHPANLDFHKENLKKMFDGLKGKAFYNETMGTHLHVNKEYIGSNLKRVHRMTYKMDYILSKFKNEILMYFNRDVDTCDEYAEILNIKKDFDNFSAYRKKKKTKYYAINVSKINTVEFRIFPSTLTYGKMIEYMEFVKNLIDLCKRKTIKGSKRVKKEDIFNKKQLELISCLEKY